MSKAPVALLIMDGFGINTDSYGNAIAAANTPNLDHYFKTCPNTTIGASGEDVGLPDGQMGNSEVGHTNIGAGRIVYQQLVKITKSIRDGVFFENPALVAAMENAKAKGKKIGRPPVTKEDIPAVFMKHYPAFVDGKMNVSEMARVCGLSRPTVYKYLKMMG